MKKERKLIDAEELIEKFRQEEPEEYEKLIKNVEKRKQEYFGRGGYREGAGRPCIYPERKTITKKLLPETLELLKDFSKENNVSENEALDRLINAGYKSLKLKKA